jgi:hypothetical protein
LANINTAYYNAESRPAASFADIDGLEIDNFKPQVAAGTKAAAISSDVRGVAIRNSPLLH